MKEILAELGVNVEQKLCPERDEFLAHYDEPFSDDWAKKLKAKKEKYILAAHRYVAEVHPHLLFEEGEDKTYWNYHTDTGIYEEINFSTVRNLVLSLLIADGLEEKATEATAKAVLARYRAEYPDRSAAYDDFDLNDGWFHARNGWVNISTLEHLPHTPKKLSRRVSDVAYDKDAVCPIYDKFLDEQIQLQKDQVRVIDQFSGLLLTPDITKQKMLVLIGKPGCGKSTLLDLWSDVLGDCSVQKGLHEISSESFRFGGSTLAGKTLCWFDEVEVTRSNMGNSLINLITGQHIHIERKGINGIVDVPNQLKCVLTANTLPRSAEMGIYRRMILIYLNYSFYDNMTDNKDIRKILQSEASGVLNRMLKGYKDVELNRGFTEIDGHSDLIEEYKASSNTVAEFLKEHFIFDYDATPIPVKTLLEAYKEFAQNDSYAKSLTPQRFGMLMSSHGLSEFDKVNAKKGSAGVRVYTGLRLNEWYEMSQTGYIRAKEEDSF